MLLLFSFSRAFQQLEVLNLSHNHLDVVPTMISYLRGLRTLHLQHNLLPCLPDTLINCRHLAEFDLTHNRLTSLPRGLPGLKQLRVLKLGENQLEQVPHELGALANLRVLDLHGNRLWYFPFSVQNLYHLLRLDLSDNLFDQVPLVLTKMPWLRALNISHNRLAVLPPDFDQMRGLRELNLSDNRFVALGVMATKLRHLKYLSLSHNRLQFLPNQTSRLQELRVLHLQDNCLEAIPDNFPNLKYLNVSDNKLKHFSVRCMPQLVALDASGNQLEAVPHGTYRLKRLRTLRLSRNAITEIPEDVGWLKQLQSLDLSENDLRNLPAALHFMDKLSSFNVRGNHKIARVTMPDNTKNATENDKTDTTYNKKKTLQDEHSNKKKKKRERDKFNRQYSSMPSLHHDTALHQDPSLVMPREKKASDWLASQDPASEVDKSWLDVFRKSKASRPHRRASWDDNMMLRTARSIPYPLDVQYSMAEMRANFSEESESDDDKFGVHDPYAVMSFHSNGSDSALDASFSSDDFHTPHAHTLYTDDKVKLLAPASTAMQQDRNHESMSHTDKTLGGSMVSVPPGAAERTVHVTLQEVAALTRAKCKYKAGKSVEQLLATLNILTSHSNDYT
nr:hypothetical protein BaRGS_019177 [Batillaria attramentaria]